MGNKKRGSGTHGAGSSKKRRGGGSRGGRGNAGLGKKAKHKKMHAIEEDYLGEKGFKQPDQDRNTVINLEQIDQRIDRLVAEGYAEETDDGYVFDADAAGYDKVLGRGRLTHDIDVNAPAFSDSARDKIEEHGNEATVTE